MKTSISFGKYLPYVKRNGHRVVYLAIILYCFYILFFLYQNLFIPFFNQTSIDPALIQRKKEVVNQTLFEQVITHSEEKVKKSTRIYFPSSNPFQ
ncbi:hypothetical protein KJ733_04360 [Patescibacteria group bacterium]|nr:hypothetical protein [Patescibacteria group bacterium]